MPMLHTLPKIMQTLRQLGAVNSNGSEYTVDSEVIFGNQEFGLGNLVSNPVVIG